MKLTTVTIAFGLALTAQSVLAQDTQSQLPPAPPEEIEALRKEINARQAAEFPTPEEIEAIRRRQLEQDRAMAVTGYSNSTERKPVARAINLINDGKGQPYQPQRLDLWSDTVTALSFFDHLGEAWPVESVSFDTSAVRVNNEGCADGGTATRLEGMGNVLTHSLACKFWTTSTIVLLTERHGRCF